MSRDIILNPFSDEPRLNGSGDLTQDAWGLQKVSHPKSLFYGMFTFDIPPQMWILHENGVELFDIATSLRAYSENGALTLKSGTVLNDETLLESRRHPRYQPNRGHLYSCSAFLPNPTSGQVDFGLFVDNENGVFFRRKEDGNLYACLLNNSVLVREELITTSFNIDLTRGNVYDIQMQWRGVGNIKFFIGSPITGTSELVHTFKNLNNLTDMSLQNPALSASVRATNVSGNEGLIRIGCVDITSEGGSTEKEQFGSAIGIATVSDGDPILAIRSPSTINGKVNTRDIHLARISANADKKSSVSIYRTRDPSAVVGGTWTRVNSSSYTEQNSTLTSVDILKMDYVTTFNVEANTTERMVNPAREHIEFYLVHGDYLVAICDSGSTVVMSSIFEWGEEV